VEAGWPEARPQVCLAHLTKDLALPEASTAATMASVADRTSTIASGQPTAPLQPLAG